jgi:hypothetical protein
MGGKPTLQTRVDIVVGPDIAEGMSKPAITTSRLLLRRWRSDDVEPFAAMCSDPEVMRYIGSGDTRTREQAAAAILAFERVWEEKSYGLFAVELLGSNQLIGFTGLAEPAFLPEIMPAVEVGWRFTRQSWGNGYATRPHEPCSISVQSNLESLRSSAFIRSGTMPLLGSCKSLECGSTEKLWIRPAGGWSAYIERAERLIWVESRRCGALPHRPFCVAWVKMI